MADLRNDLARARDEWMLTDAGERACDPHTLGRPPRSGEYLRNRIEAAFVAGWNARERKETPHVE